MQECHVKFLLLLNFLVECMSEKRMMLDAEELYFVNSGCSYSGYGYKKQAINYLSEINTFSFVYKNFMV